MQGDRNIYELIRREVGIIHQIWKKNTAHTPKSELQASDYKSRICMCDAWKKWKTCPQIVIYYGGK